MLFYRAPFCKACHVKRGMGTCEKCEATRKELADVERDMRAFLQKRKEREESDPSDRAEERSSNWDW